MSNVIYEEHPPSVLNDLDDVNAPSPNNGDTIVYDSTQGAFVAQPGGGGGGSFLGPNDSVLFKSGTTSATSYADGITDTIAASGYTMNVDRLNKRIGINKASPAATLDVNGIALITDGTDTLKIQGDEVGISAGTQTLKLYSNNLPAISDGLTEINSTDKVVTSSGLLSKAPTAFDAPNGTPDGAFYKIKLDNGLNLQPPGHPLWDEQLPFDPTTTQFPTGQIVEYHDTLPRDFKRIIGRTATGVAVAPATTYVISFFGSTFNFQDRCIYDPCMMRSRKAGTGWTWAGAPPQYRDPDIKAMLKVRWYFEGRWASSNPANRLDIYVNQYRNGSSLRGFLTGISNNADSCFMSGERNFLGYANLGEDIDWSTDDFQVEVANQGNFDVTVDLAQVELEFILAQ